MGGEVISTDTGTRLVPLFARKSQGERKREGKGHPETDSQRQRVIRVRHGATARLDL